MKKFDLSLAFLCEQVETETSSGAKRRMTPRVLAFILETGMVKTRIQERKQAREWMTTRGGYPSSSHT